MRPQTEKVLNAFLSAPKRALTTGQLDDLPYIVCQSQEVSRLRQMGYVISCQRVKGTRSSLFTLESTPGELDVPDVKAQQWLPIGNGFEVRL